MALQPAKAAPKFNGTAVINGQFKEISLDDYKGKYVVLVFYPPDSRLISLNCSSLELRGGLCWLKSHLRSENLEMNIRLKWMLSK